MNKNSIVAFLIIIGSVMLFTSPNYQKFYTEKILKKEYKVKKEYKKSSNYSNQKIEQTTKKIEKEAIEEISTADEIIKKEERDSNVIKNDTVWIENEKLIIGIQELGASIISIKLKKYKNDGDGKPIELIKDNAEPGLSLKIGEKSYKNKIFTYMGEKKRVTVFGKIEVVFKNNEDENEIKKIFEFNQNDYLIGLTIEKNSLPGDKITIGWNCGIEESEKVIKKRTVVKKIAHLSSIDNVQHFVLKNGEKEGPVNGRYQWVGVTSKYFFIAVNNDSIKDSDIKIEAFEDKEKQINYSFELSRIAEKQKEKFSLYCGPKERKEIIQFNKKYEKTLFPVIGWTKIFFWSERWFPWLAEKVLQLLLIIQSIVKDYGLAIILITIITKIITYPLTISSMKSMERMKDIQPKVNSIRQKHKNNPQRMNEEVMALYKKEGVNPLNPGCLPMFLQTPIFISLFVVLQNAIEIRGATTFLIPWIKDLSKAEEIFSLAGILPNGIPMYGTNVAILPIIMAVLTFFQQKATTKDPNQKMMIYFMPIFMLALFNSFPSGLVLYWTFSNATQLLQQFIMKKKKV